ncbi:MAG TPA: triose-phosphate isomerase [Chthoniobacterales bacterium]|jgi:triosephosphate isomerase
MRKKILAANWKMNLTQSEVESYVTTFALEIGEVDDVEVVIIPPFTAIPLLVSASEKMPSIRIGAQNMHWEKSGAFTGEVSGAMLRALFVKYVILGHSERRTLFGETDEIVNRKVRAALDAGLRPILCVGETLYERDNDKVEEVLGRQVRKALEGVAQKDLSEFVIAYEPCWAIGTGRTASPDQAENAHAFIRSVLSEISNPATADRIRIQYGGSVKPENTGELMRQKNIDGALIGGASLDPRSFVRIIRNTEAALA